jgi:hypothetical protein
MVLTSTGRYGVDSVPETYIEHLKHFLCLTYPNNFKHVGLCSTVCQMYSLRTDAYRRSVRVSKLCSCGAVWGRHAAGCMIEASCASVAATGGVLAGCCCVREVLLPRRNITCLRRFTICWAVWADSSRTPPRSKLYDVRLALCGAAEQRIAWEYSCFSDTLAHFVWCPRWRGDTISH